MQDQEKQKDFVFVDRETGERYVIEGATVEKEQVGGDWKLKIEFTTSKTQLVFVWIAMHVTTYDKGGPGVEDGRRILRTVYDKLDAITIEPKEGGGILCNWRVKPNIRPDQVNKEMLEVLGMPIFHAAIQHVFGVAQKEVEIKRGAGGVRSGAHWIKAKFPERNKRRKITAEEHRLEFALLKLLRDYSTHRDREHPLYLLGNGGEQTEKVPAGIDGKTFNFSEEVKVAVLEVPGTEVYKTYTCKGSAQISKGERQRVDALLEKMQQDIETICIPQIQPGQNRIKWYEISRPKITLDKIADLTQEEAEARAAGADLPEGRTLFRICFHPAFTIDIGQKYSLYPEDYLERMERAIGGGRSSSKHWLLVDYLNGIRGSGNLDTAANLDTLIAKLDLERLRKKQGGPKAAAEVEEAIKVAQKVGLVLGWSRTPGRRGQDLYQFKLNPKFGKE